MSNTNWIREPLRKLMAAAERGDDSARIELAKRYFAGRDVSRDPKESFSWVSSAAERGNTEAIRMMGHCYATGTGVSASGRKAYDLFVKAALRGDAVATYNLAICYDYGMGVEHDWQMAQELYSKSAQMGYAKAKHVLVARLWNKDTDDDNSEHRDTILAWYAAQANKGDEIARKNLALVRKNRRVRTDKELEL